MTKHDRVEVESILIDRTKLGEALREVWSAYFNLACEIILQPAYHRLDVILNKCGVGAD